MMLMIMAAKKRSGMKMMKTGLITNWNELYLFFFVITFYARVRYEIPHFYLR